MVGLGGLDEYEVAQAEPFPMRGGGMLDPQMVKFGAIDDEQCPPSPTTYSSIMRWAHPVEVLMLSLDFAVL